jgi:hydrogenase maturation protease
VHGRIGVIGIGNVLMGDDAFGPHVIRVLQAGYAFAPGVDVQDMGTPGLDLTAYLAGLDALVLVDTVKSAGAPESCGGTRAPRSCGTRRSRGSAPTTPA